MKRTSSMPIPELDRPASTNGSKTSLPYPSFSKAHSKEAVGSREDVVGKRFSYYTPDPTDLDRSNTQKDETVIPKGAGAPPSPPLTTVEPPARGSPEIISPPSDEIEVQEEEEKLTSEEETTKRSSEVKPSSKKSTHLITKEDPTIRLERKRTDLQRAAEDLKRRLHRGNSAVSSESRSDRKSSLSRAKKSQADLSKDDAKSLISARKSKPSTPSKLKPRLATVEDATSSTTHHKPLSDVQSVAEVETPAASNIDSDATSIAPNQPSIQQPSISFRDGRSSIVINTDSPPQTPTPSEPEFPPTGKETPAFIIGDLRASGPYDNSPAPPPPPPPPQVSGQVPKVDYLMLNGGLSQSIPRAFLGAGQPAQASQNEQSSNPEMKAHVDKFFAPFNNLLDDYTKVVSRNGSLAVATGYRSIARRLLDRLEAVFARDISSEVCTCIVCESVPWSSQIVEDEKGVSWGEILELVCGRQELPPWPAFVMDSTEAGLGISTDEQKPPMQHLDIDVPDEFREHYVRQSKKTKQSVDRWLANQLQSPTSPPPDVDDETLTFAMLTRLEPEQRPLFSSLVGVAPSRPPSRAATPLMAPRSSLLEQTGLAIQRLYHLSSPPRDPESAMYLLSNPPLHNVLATLAAISDDEWEILTSGRFDGFLRSGAEDHSNPFPPPAQVPSRGPSAAARMTPFAPYSRGTTPFSRGPTPSPASVGAPVSLDEETEIAVLAEVEREIFLGMEALEDAFEALHLKAELVRRELRDRGAGLSLASQTRRGPRDLDARLGTPASAGLYGWDSETDDGIDDGVSELAPDDSASNVSRSRHRRPKRRTERRTPALVEEEDEESEA